MIFFMLVQKKYDVLEDEGLRLVVADYVFCTCAGRKVEEEGLRKRPLGRKSRGEGHCGRRRRGPYRVFQKEKEEKTKRRE